MRRQWVLGWMLLGIGSYLLIACDKQKQSPAKNSVAAVVNAVTVDRLVQVEEFEQRWLAHKVNSYRIKIREGGVWSEHAIDITVKQGRVTDAWVTAVSRSSSPFAGPPDRQYGMDIMEAESYLVPGLFIRARSLFSGRDKAHARIAYDRTYDFPHNMSVDNPDVFDDECGLSVVEFEALK